MINEELIKRFQIAWNTCPYCKNVDTWQTIEHHYGKKYILRNCSCGAKFTIKEPTEENLEKFEEWENIKS